MFFLSGVAKYLFVPLAEAVVFAMLASYLLSRTVVPTMAKYLLREHDPEEGERKLRSRNPFIVFQLAFESRFEKIRRGYRRMLEFCIAHSALFIVLFFVLSMGSAALLYPFLGEDFFPSVDSGQFKLHVRARTGTRIEDMAALCDRIDNTIRQVIPKNELVTIIDNIGLPYSGINTSYSNSAPVGPADADIQVSLTEHHRPTDEYVARLRAELPRRFPGTEFYTLPVDMVTQILNFGLPSPIDIQIVGPNQQGNLAFAEHLLNQVKYVPGAADMRIQQSLRQSESHRQRESLHGAERGVCPARRDAEPAGGDQRQLSDLADVLPRSAERRGIQHCRAVAAVCAGYHAGSAQYSFDPGQR